ncbi:MAG TPA: D-TA family PLP-dependent enzyme [Cyclobacteriaceae bacterium]
MNSDWYTINNIDQIDSPALAVYTERAKENIKILKGFVDDVTRLRPHVKTHKSSEISKMLMDASIKKFKCATIAEAEMLAIAGAPDVLLAYQPVGPKATRLAALIKKYPSTKFSCLIDNLSVAKHISELTEKSNLAINVFIDVNVGMNRTGIIPEQSLKLFEECQLLKGITIVGLHAYDGHLRDPDLEVRKKQCDEGYSKVEILHKQIKDKFSKDLLIIAGGTPSFSIHAKRKGIECSPGTYIYWDKNYGQTLTEQPFLHAALVITRVISKPDDETITVDLGHKSIASENPLPNRVTFLNAPDLQPFGHSEEHLVLKAGKGNTFKVGDVLYGLPYHICPTVALHDRVQVIEDGKAVGTWSTLARNRIITI